MARPNLLRKSERISIALPRVVAEHAGRHVEQFVGIPPELRQREHLLSSNRGVYVGVLRLQSPGRGGYCDGILNVTYRQRDVESARLLRFDHDAL